MVNCLAELDRSFTALAHPIRRTIVERLAEGTATVGEATRGANVSKPAISRHLRVLEEAGVIVRTVEGRTHRLRLEPGRLDEATDWMLRQQRLWVGKFDAVERHLQAQRETREER